MAMTAEEKRLRRTLARAGMPSSFAPGDFSEHTPGADTVLLAGDDPRRATFRRQTNPEAVGATSPPAHLIEAPQIDVNKYYEDLANLHDTPIDYSAVTRAAKAQRDEADRDTKAALALSMLGGRSMQKPSEFLLRSALARSEPLRGNMSDTGYFDPSTGQFVENPLIGRRSKEQRLGAAIETGIRAQERQYNKLVEQKRTEEANAIRLQMAADAEALRRLQLAETERHNRATEKSRQQRADAASGYSKETAQSAQRRVALRDLDKGLTNYGTLLDSFDPRGWDQLKPEKRAEIGTAHSDLIVKAKDLYGLGALSGADLTLIESVLTPPTSLKGATIGKDALKAQLRQVRGMLRRAEQAMNEQYGPTRERIVADDDDDGGDNSGWKIEEVK